MQNRSDRPGRWRTGEQSRRRILEAARSCFGKHGYDRATIRAIATEANVDPAMVHYFFDTKAQLFSVAMELTPNVPERLTSQLESGVDGLGERLVRHFVEVWDEQAGIEPLLALMRSAHPEDGSASMFAEFVEREIVARLRDAIGGPDEGLRAELVASHLIGLALMRYILRLEPLAAVPPEAITAWMGPTLQHYISGNL